jgi:hypothetical protein
MEQQADELRKLLKISGTKGLIGPDTRTYNERMADMGAQYAQPQTVYPLGTAPANSMDAWDRRLLGEKQSPLTVAEFGGPLTDGERAMVESAIGETTREAAPAAAPAPAAPATATAPVEDWNTLQAQAEENWLSPAPTAPKPSPLAANGIPLPDSALPAPLAAIPDTAKTFARDLAPVGESLAPMAEAVAAPVAAAAAPAKDWVNIGTRTIEKPVGPVPKSLYNPAIESFKRAGSMGGKGGGAATGALTAAAEGAAGGPMGIMGGVGLSLLGSLLGSLLKSDPAPEPVDTLDLQPAQPYETPEPPTFASAQDVDRRLFGWA